MAVFLEPNSSERNNFSPLFSFQIRYYNMGLSIGLQISYLFLKISFWVGNKAPETKSLRKGLGHLYRGMSPSQPPNSTIQCKLST